MSRPFAQSDRPSRPKSPAFGGLALLFTSLLLVGIPLGAVAWGLLAENAEPLRTSESKSLVFLLLRSVASAGTVAFLAVILALGPAWYVRSKGWRSMPWLLVPMVAPSYLAYSGWQLLRSPGTWLGDWLEGQTASSETTAVIIGRAFAFGGSALWSWPLAMLFLAPAFRAIPEAVLHAMDIDGASRWRKALETSRMARNGLVSAWVGVTLVMLGSAVPFHLAQVPTFAIDVWMTLVERPGDHGVWLRAWPVIAVAVTTAILVGRWTAHAKAPEDAQCDVTHCQGKTWSTLWSIAAWCASVAVPLCLFAGYLHSWSSIPEFCRNALQAILQNGLVALFVAIGTAILTVLAWAAAVSWRTSRGWLAVSMGLLVLGLVVPGILMGSAVLNAIDGGARLFAPIDILRDGVGGLVWGHLARFGGIGALAGFMLAMAEGKEARELRALDGCGWWTTVWHGLIRPWGGVVVAVGVAGGLLSMFEIEATILLVPPGPGSLSHTLLGFLHFAKDEQLSAAGVAIMGGGILVAGLAAWLAQGSLRNR